MWKSQGQEMIFLLSRSICVSNVEKVRENNGLMKNQEVIGNYRFLQNQFLAALKRNHLFYIFNSFRIFCATSFTKTQNEIVFIVIFFFSFCIIYHSSCNSYLFISYPSLYCSVLLSVLHLKSPKCYFKITQLKILN